MQDIIFLHGALGSSNLYDPLIAKMKHVHQCHSFNFSGHGGAPFRMNFTIQEFAKELEEFIDIKGIKECVVFGHSMGGYTAMYSSAMGNKRIQKIITLGTKFLWTPEIASKESEIFDIELLKEKFPLFAEQLKITHGDNWEGLVYRVKLLLSALGSNPVLSDKIVQKINIPVLLCLGEKDKMVTLDETMKIADLLECSKLTLLPAQPHLLERVDVDLLKELLIENVS